MFSAAARGGYSDPLSMLLSMPATPATATDSAHRAQRETNRLHTEKLLGDISAPDK